MDNEFQVNTGSFLGRGWGFPPEFDQETCDVRMVSEADDICESLHILLSTRMGERLLRPNFGCNLHKMNFEPVNLQFITFIKTFIEQSILLHEPRIQLQRVHIDTTNQFDGLILIEVQYIIRATNSPHNFVFDYYLQEAQTSIPAII